MVVNNTVNITANITANIMAYNTANNTAYITDPYELRVLLDFGPSY